MGTYSQSINQCNSIGMFLIMPSRKQESEEIADILKMKLVSSNDAWFSKTTSGKTKYDFRYADGSFVDMPQEAWAEGYPATRFNATSSECVDISCGYVSNDGLFYDTKHCEKFAMTICQSRKGNNNIKIAFSISFKFN